LLLVIPYAAAMLPSQSCRCIYREDVFACVIRTKESITTGSQSPPLAAWTVVCLSAHTSREGKHGTQCSFLTEKELQYTRDVIKKARK